MSYLIIVFTLFLSNSFLFGGELVLFNMLSTRSLSSLCSTDSRDSGNPQSPFKMQRKEDRLLPADTSRLSTEDLPVLSLFQGKMREATGIMREIIRVKKISSAACDRESVNPIFKDVENNFVRYVFRYYLELRKDLIEPSAASEKWMDKVFNRFILKRDQGALAILNVIFPPSFSPGDDKDKENMLFVRNYELFECFFAQKSGNEERIKKSIERYQSYNRE